MKGISGYVLFLSGFRTYSTGEGSHLSQYNPSSTISARRSIEHSPLQVDLCEIYTPDLLKPDEKTLVLNFVCFSI